MSTFPCSSRFVLNGITSFITVLYDILAEGVSEMIFLKHISLISVKENPKLLYFKIKTHTSIGLPSRPNALFLFILTKTVFTYILDIS